jgi:2-hydroxy-6-oxonona-2,4-dienedioate hydrolase
VTRENSDGLDRSKLRSIVVNGIRTRLYDAGRGPALLLLHGGQYGSLYSLDSWSLNLPYLARDRRVLAPDRLGQGHTEAPKSDDELTMHASTRHAIELISLIGAGPVDVVGHSRGGLVALQLAIHQPELVRSVVLVDSHSAAPPDANAPLGVFYAEMERRVAGRPPSREVVGIEPLAQAYRPETVTDDFVERLLEIALLPSRLRTAERMHSAGRRVFIPSVIEVRDAALAHLSTSGLRMPALVIWGYDDRSAPRALGYRLYEAIAQRTQGAELHVLKDAGHYVFRDRPEDFERVVTAFLERSA